MARKSRTAEIKYFGEIYLGHVKYRKMLRLDNFPDRERKCIRFIKTIL